jgi:hypothetical protein
MDEAQQVAASEPLGRVARIRARRITRYGLGYFGWVPVSAMGVLLMFGGLSGLAANLWLSGLAVLGGLACLGVGWAIVTSRDPDEQRSARRAE